MDIPDGREVLRVTAAEQLDDLNSWIDDARLEDEVQFDSGDQWAFLAFAQESEWGERHPREATAHPRRRKPLFGHSGR